MALASFFWSQMFVPFDIPANADLTVYLIVAI
jgi:hypothetical protein